MQAQKIVYIILLFISTTYSARAQKFVNLDNRWRMIAYPNWVGTHPYLTFFKDSVEIEGKYYYQRYTSVDPTLQNIDTTREYYREVAGIVYYYSDPGSTNRPQERVIYNFNLNVGDSIDLITYRLKVVKIDSITLLDGSTRKRWELSTRQFAVNLYWVEGIGAIDLETLRPPVAAISDGANSFSCYFYKNELLYSYPYGVGNNDGLSCAPRLGADPVSTRDVRELSRLQVLQNYGDGQLSFRLEDPGQYQCKLFNALGALLEQKALSQGNNHFSLTAFPKGIYFLQVFDLKNLRQKTLKLIWQ
ncbi:T9SS type A sorting domain-containing protein [Haliscomenobacter hydrossis]|uniref:Secretion system C-terminal sorting domain-containing protein n=1 Tax=Haliscomenobacter hydrossis (strain ATCC 27775 / DSM 1100 / LMG 10767 / O) TaxID=760192 RepID=F4KTJ5_HALH1|nr:T9SS type A sorting domain-containing protein [Haliscomenobacter hydrossis]AEE53369.1 hypothetical protein Halhy_5544 [Haliscomenobacter hydrossis DSM 1100]